MIDPGLREAARQLGISHSYLSRLAREKRVPRNGDKTFNVEAVRRTLAAITDPSQIRKGGSGKWLQNVTRAPKEPVPAASGVDQPETLANLALRTALAANPATDFDCGVIAGVLMAGYSAGAIGGLIAVEEGVCTDTAKAIEKGLSLAALQRGEMLMRMLPSFADFAPDQDLPIAYEIDAFWKVDWAVVDAERENST